MFSTSPGGAVETTGAPDRAALRRDHDAAAFVAARERAEAECLALLAALHNHGTQLPLLTSQARETMRAAGSLWEAASCLAE